MYFKQIEIVGFKSFMNKTKLKFEPGVTAIVGPNGCGKSNVVDAMKWVLGDQSAKSMRSSIMQDVIFNGTERQDPLNVAEVSLTLSNEDRALPVDYDEVTISRRLYRSGESEYLLNKTPVRLTDVRNLILGTGIGTSSYSIVEQGRMDMILSSKPEERRHIFEEASGITLYKAKKREAMLKLDRTKENLVRINDIVREVERQINSIERKARKAERYKGRYDQLKDLETKLSYKKYKELSTNDISLGSTGGELKEKEETLVCELEGRAGDIVRMRAEFNDTFEELQRTQGEIMTLSSSIDKNEHTIHMNTERVEELKKSVERLSQEIEDTAERRNSLKERLNNLEVRFSGISGKRESKRSELVSAEEEVRDLTTNLERNRHNLKFSREKTVDLVDAQTKTKNSLIKINSDMQHAQAREKRLKLERHNVEVEKGNVQEKLAGIQERVDEVKRDLEHKRNEHEIFTSEFSARQNTSSQLMNEKSEKEKELNRIRPRRMLLEKLIQEREGVNVGAKEVMSRIEAGDPRFSGVHGILSEIINVDENYEESMRVILGETSQALVVEDQETVDRVTEFLRENSLGSTNFVVLVELRSVVESGGGVSITKGTLDDITHVLMAKEPYCSSLRMLLSNTFVTVSSEAARAYVIDNTDFDGCIIGEKGELYQTGLRRSRNYSDKEVIPIFGRKEKVDEMLKSEEQIERELKETEEKVEELEKWLKESARRKERLEAELQAKQIEYADVSSKRASIKEKFDSLSEEMLVLGTEINEEKTNIEQFRSEVKRLEEVLAISEEENEKLQRMIEEAAEAIQRDTKERERVLFVTADLKAEHSTLLKEEETFSDNIGRERDSYDRVEHDVEARRSRIEENTRRIDDLTREVEALGKENVESKAILEARSGEISGKREKKESMSQRINSEEESRGRKEKELEGIRNRTRDLDIQKKEIEYKRDALVQRMLDAYKTDIRSLVAEISQETNWEEVTSRIEDLKEQLEKMGDVSLGAVEEHEQLKERFEFLAKQRDDLENGRETLLKAITQINRTTRKMFVETFESIKVEFNTYFKMLFNGGKAELVLEDENNILECGIDIIVRPPGKKLQNIMQLSGGEKAMTAIALIFAIFKVNPSPFCVLDEIDAPLDESNIVRFCRVLQDFLKLSQFIIVTHNRMTIQLADVLYGITMEEKGVSKIVSVKFSEEKEIREEATVPAGA